MTRKKYRFNEREFLFNHLKKSTEFLTDNQINKILDEHKWRDLNFLFIVDNNNVQVIITDNQTGCDVALEDLNSNAKHFYHTIKRKLSKRDLADYIKLLLNVNKCKEIKKFV
ncbi:hypothetical protein BSK59_13370 [Paenibacillus odorifer]|uniref:hypothetical protein n=1 Tax=Paenibacillus odorifer TaxID=189426 RepID=UPI00096DA2C8|nr:hypothetical protein [Paenibacillus odorifer]OME55462.1 hypothetical protein BSK59_13370 [Paenibacillus odorifer]